MPRSPRRRQARVVPIDSGARLRARRDRLVLAHLHLVDPIAWALLRHVNPCFEVDDLISLGRMGLMQAATRYRPAAYGNTPFAAYAKQRIRGAILDGLRRKNWIEAQHESLHALPGDQIDRPVEMQVEAIDARRMLARLLEGRLRRLTPLQTRVLSLYYSSDPAPTLQQIAARLGISAEVISREYAAGMAALRAQFSVR